ncbi:GNAT family N-acetyltransferase [Pseudonocardia sp. H11422]|uniref:GNAT family N-acetyltransferase n=1 Tax=Pseudonocardia sp. H11422 TaxID=2835866 RepID=UPI0027E336D3|nr:GNAT family N-acetyltransferase [Pseudonocardia sp. H11422]
MGTDVLDIREHRYDETVVQELIAELQAEYVVRYGDEDRSPVDAADFTPPRGFFLIAWRGVDAVASVAMRAVDDEPGWVEVKRLYVRPPHRRQGLARAMLRGAEERARTAGYRRVILETGTEQPESLELYPSEGYEEIPQYGYYAGQPHSVCFGKTL